MIVQSQRQLESMVEQVLMRIKLVNQKSDLTMSLSELIPPNNPVKRFKHRRTQSSSEQEIHRFGMAPKLVTEPASDSSFSQFPSAKETQALLQMMQQKPKHVISIVEPIENNLSRCNLYNSLFNFGKQQTNTKPVLIDSNSSGNPYSLNLKDSNLFLIPELSDFGSATPSLNHQRVDLEPKHQKVNSLNILSSSQKQQQKPYSQTLSSQLKNSTQTQPTPNKLSKLDFNDIKKTPPQTLDASSPTQSTQQSANKKHQTDVQSKHIFTNRKKQSKEKIPISTDFIQKTLKTYLSKQKESPIPIHKNQLLRMSLNDEKSPPDNLRAFSNYTFSHELTSLIDSNYRENKSSCSTGLKDGSSSLLNRSEEGFKLRGQITKIEKDLLDRINQLEAEVIAMKSKNQQVESFNKSLLKELKSSNRQQKQILDKNNELEGRLMLVEQMLKFPTRKLNSSNVLTNIYKTDISLDIQIDPDILSRKHMHFHTEG